MCGMLISADSATDLGATTVVAQALSPTQKTCLFTNGNKANVSVCLSPPHCRAAAAAPAASPLGR